MAFITALAAIASAMFLMICLAYRKAFYSSPKRREDIYSIPDGGAYEGYGERMRGLISDMEKQAWETVQIVSHDGLRLSGRYLHAADGAPVHIQMHGYRGTAFRDFCGGNRIVREMGHNTLLVDQRAHGKSGGKTITFGVKERQDLMLWAGYIADRFGEDTDIFLSGVSMGAATVIMASGMEFPGNVRGIIADCPYSSPGAIIKKVCRDMGLPVKAAYFFARTGARIFGGFDTEGISCPEAVAECEIPVMIIHGEADGFVPCDMSREIFEANPGMIRLETFPDAGHGMSYMVDTERYEQAVREFIEFCLGV